MKLTINCKMEKKIAVRHKNRQISTVSRKNGLLKKFFFKILYRFLQDFHWRGYERICF